MRLFQTISAFSVLRPHFFPFVPSHRPGAYPSYFKEIPFPFHTNQAGKIQRGAAAARLAGERQYGLYMPISDTVSRQGGGLQQTFDHPSLKGLVQIEKGRKREPDLRRTRDNPPSTQDLPDDGLQIIILLADDLGGMAERLDDPGIISQGQFRNEFMPDPVAQEKGTSGWNCPSYTSALRD